MRKQEIAAAFCAAAALCNNVLYDLLSPLLMLFSAFRLSHRWWRMLRRGGGGGGGDGCRCRVWPAVDWWVGWVEWIDCLHVSVGCFNVSCVLCSLLVVLFVRCLPVLFRLLVCWLAGWPVV